MSFEDLPKDKQEALDAIDKACTHGEERKAKTPPYEGICFDCLPRKLRVLHSNEEIAAELKKENYVYKSIKGEW